MRLRYVAGQVGAFILAALAAGPACALDLRCGEWSMQIGPGGGLVQLRGPGGAAAGLGEEAPLWAVRFRDGRILTPADLPAPRVRKAGRGVRVQWAGKALEAQLSLRAGGDRFELALRIANRGEAPITDVALPYRLPFAADRVRLVSWPQGLGVGFRREWFLPGRGGRWESLPVADRGMRRLLGFGCRMLDLPGRALPARVTPLGEQVLGPGLAALIRANKVVVVRPPERPADAVLVENDDGPYLCGIKLGRGWFFYCTGRSHSAFMLACGQRIIQHYVRGPGEIGVIVLPGLDTGFWCEARASAWLKMVQTKIARLSPRRIASATELKAALQDAGVRAIINPYAEHLVADSPDEALETIDAIRQFIRRGGLWMDAGGYPFYYALRRSKYERAQLSHPPAFADFVHFDTTAGSWAVFSLQPPADVPIFVPAVLSLEAAELRGRPCGVFTRWYKTWIAPGKAWQAPPVVFLLGRGLRQACRDYVELHGFKRGPDKKVTRLGALEAFKRSVLVRLYGATAREYLDNLASLQAPAIVHMTEHLHIGFDRAYPDYLPPPERFGSMEDLRRIYRLAHRLGFLMMPYVNPTWWCEEAPSLKKYGTQALARSPEGELYRESYGRPPFVHRGYSVCPWHPLIRKLDDRCLRWFVDDLGCDILFQDQIGARSMRYDFNPASPTPWAYSEGMVRIARHDSRFVPLSTEGGFDRLINWELQFCGPGSYGSIEKVEQPRQWVSFEERFAKGTWQHSPLALYMAHDKVSFALHDLGHFVTTERVLAACLGLGQHLSLAVRAAASPRSRPKRWLAWLQAVQRHVASRYMFEPLLEFRHLSDLAFVAHYGDLKVAANLGPEPLELAEATLASPGWYATDAAGELVAGRLARFRGRTYDPPLEFIHLPRQHAWIFYGSGTVQVPLAGPEQGMRPDGESAFVASVERKQGAVVLNVKLGAIRQWPPEGLAKLPPQRWPRRPELIGVVDMGPNGPKPGWADAGPDRWMEAFARSARLRSLGLRPRRLRSPSELLAALQQPRRWFAIINPYGERFPVPSPDDVDRVLQAVADYVDAGGIWWETGGFSFYYPCWPDGDGWRVGKGMAGLARILGAPLVLADNPPAEQVQLTAFASRLPGLGGFRPTPCKVNRPLPEQDYPGLVLVRGPSGPYVAGYQLSGWGYLFRVGGIGQFEVTWPVAEAMLAWLYTNPPAEWPPAALPGVVQVQLE